MFLLLEVKCLGRKICDLPESELQKIAQALPEYVEQKTMFSLHGELALPPSSTIKGGLYPQGLSIHQNNGEETQRQGEID